MKKLFFAALMMTGMTAFGQNTIQFKETSHSFGKITQNVPVTYIFKYTNTGAKPVVVEYANAECGCTTPEYAKEPILKGKTSTIKVTYNAAAAGTFKKKVDVKFVNSNQPYVLLIDGEVIPAKTK